MSKPAPQHAEPVNADSFLDIVASVVCIMLIMIVMVGMRIKSMPVDPPQSAEEAQTAADLSQARAAEESLRNDVLRVAAEAEGIQRETAARGLQRDLLATALSAMEHDLVLRGGQGKAGGEVDPELARRVAEARRQLADLRRVRVQVDAEEPPPAVVESFPTPLSRTVDERETHFQLRNGRIVRVPFDELVDEVMPDVRRNWDKSKENRERPEPTRELQRKVGPIDNFILEYTFAKTDSPKPPEVRFTIAPTADNLGELPDEALRQGSDFRQALAELPRGRKTVTIWVYPDSFDAFRKIRKALYEAKIEIAAWPRSADEPIGGSNVADESSKSAAQ